MTHTTLAQHKAGHRLLLRPSVASPHQRQTSGMNLIFVPPAVVLTTRPADVMCMLMKIPNYLNLCLGTNPGCCGYFFFILARCFRQSLCKHRSKSILPAVWGSTCHCMWQLHCDLILSKILFEHAYDQNRSTKVSKYIFQRHQIDNPISASGVECQSSKQIKSVCRNLVSVFISQMQSEPVRFLNCEQKEKTTDSKDPITNKTLWSTWQPLGEETVLSSLLTSTTSFKCCGTFTLWRTSLLFLFCFF